MSKDRSFIMWVVAFLVLSWVLTGRGSATEKSAVQFVEEIKQIVRPEGKYSRRDLADNKFSAGLRIAILDQMKSPEGVAGLIEIILDPGFIEFDRKFSHDQDGNYVKRQVGDPLVGPMVKTCWRLYTQPLVDEATIPSIGTDRSWEYRHHGLYGHKVEALVADCTAWCREVQAGRMTFQMKGDPTRYNRYGKAASESRSVRREHRNQKGKDEVNPVKEGEKGGSLTWFYVLLGVLLAAALGVLVKQKAVKS